MVLEKLAHNMEKIKLDLLLILHKKVESRDIKYLTIKDKYMHVWKEYISKWLEGRERFLKQIA